MDLLYTSTVVYIIKAAKQVAAHADHFESY